MMMHNMLQLCRIESKVVSASGLEFILSKAQVQVL